MTSTSAQAARISDREDISSGILHDVNDTDNGRAAVVFGARNLGRAAIELLVAEGWAVTGVARFGSVELSDVMSVDSCVGSM